MIGDACVGVSVSVVRRGGRGEELLFMRRSGGRFGGQWWPVTGTRERGETPVACALRELQEETGLVPTGLYDTFFRAAVEGGRGHLRSFVAIVPADAVVRLNWEHDGLRWCSLDEARLFVPSIAWRTLDEARRILDEEPGDQRIEIPARSPAG